MSSKPPPDRRTFRSDWDEIIYLYDKIIYWLYGLCGSAMRPVLGASVAVAVLIIARHHQNIVRLLKHNEPPFALRSRSHE